MNVEDIKTSPLIDFEPYREHIDGVRAYEQPWNYCYYKVVYGTPKSVSVGVQRGDICYGAIRAFDYVMGIISYVLPPKDPDDVERYADWLINRSVARKSFINKDAKNCLEYGFVHDANLPGKYMQLGILMLRALSEHCRVLDLWIEMVDAGVEEHLALYWSYAIAPSKYQTQSSRAMSNIGDYCVRASDSVGLGTHGYPFPNSIDEQTLINICKGELTDLQSTNTPFYRQRVYTGVHALFGPPMRKSGMVHTYLKGLVEEFGEKGMKVRRDPFRTIHTEEVSTLKTKDAVPKVIEDCLTWQEEFLDVET